MDDLRVRRSKLADQRDDAARSRRVRPDPEAAAQLYVSIAPAALARGDVLTTGTASPTSAALSNPAGFGGLVLGAPPVAVHPDGSLAGRRVCRLVRGRWCAMNHYCPCGPVQPQTTLTLSIDFLRATKTTTAGHASWATARDTTTVPLLYGQTPGLSGYTDAYAWLGDVHNQFQRVDLATHVQGGAFYSADFNTNPPLVSGFGVGYAGLFDSVPPAATTRLDGEAIFQNFEDAYLSHLFTLRCSRSGYDLIHEMRNIRLYGFGGGIVGPVAVTSFGVGYRVTYRGTVVNGVPFRCEFGGPTTYEAIDATGAGGSLFDARYTTFYTGEQRKPRIIGGPYAYLGNDTADSVATSSGVTHDIDAATLVPPFGVYEMVVTS